MSTTTIKLSNKVHQTTLNNYFNATAGLIYAVHGVVTLELFRKLTKDSRTLVSDEQIKKAESGTFATYSVNEIT
jgi:hypothetical protein